MIEGILSSRFGLKETVEGRIACIHGVFGLNCG